MQTPEGIMLFIVAFFHAGNQSRAVSYGDKKDLITYHPASKGKWKKSSEFLQGEENEGEEKVKGKV